MHIQLQCCGIVLMLVLFYFYMRQKRISLDTEKAFLGVFLSTLVCIIMDILSIGAIEFRHVLSEPFAKFVAKTYLVTLLGVSVSALSYMCVNIYADNRKSYKKQMNVYLLMQLVSIVGIYAAPLYFDYTNNGADVKYTYGPSVYVTYGMALVFFLRILYLIRKERSKINPRRREAVVVWMLIWIVASQIQFMYTNILIVSYAGAIGIMVLYLKLENPEMNLDRSSGLFNSGALYQYLIQLVGKRQDFAMLAIIFENTAFQHVSLDKRGLIRMQIVEYLIKSPDIYPFKSAEDEFIIMFTDMEKAEQKVEEIRRRFASGWGLYNGDSVRPCWLYVPHGNIANQAEILLYLIRYIRRDEKAFNENDFLLIEKDTVDKIHHEREVLQLILDAIDDDRVEVFYQPIFSTDEKRITSAEALVRIRGKDGKLVPPGVFIDIAEETGMILKLGAIVFEKVCKFIANHPLERYGMQYIEINLSVIQCGDEHLARDYIDIMDRYKVAPKYINLEITESASTNAKKTLLNNMDDLMKYGVRFSLDDFGTGQSNLNYIVDMPVDIIKFDRSMTNSYFENGKAKHVMEAAIHMIHGMNLEIVSEGIETKEQYETMEDLGISHIQGYYFSKPLPEDEFLDFLENRRNKDGDAK